MPLVIKYTTGYAGTGKSYQLIEKLKSVPIDTTIVLAPTHKALARLSPYLPNTIEIKTIHSLLGWIPSINEEAKQVSHIDSTIKLSKELDEYSHIIIDEAGMISEDMFFDIISKVEMYSGIEGEDINKEVEIHCFLDPYQLLPVKGHQIQLDPLTTTNLTKQYRSESLDIVNTYTKFVDYLIGTNITDLSIEYSSNIKIMDINKFKIGDRLLAYTNKAVGEWNNIIANNLGISTYEGSEVQLGSMLDLVVCKSFVEPTLIDLLLWYKSGYLKLQNSRINKDYLDLELKSLIDNKDIMFITDDIHIYPVILGVGNANKILRRAKEKAIKNKAKFKDVYTLGRAYIMDYPFATTVHKAQGSEFDTVFIDREDIKKSIRNSYYMTYARLMYVAISRCKKTLYITS